MFSAIAIVIIFFLEMVNCYYKNLKFPVILILIRIILVFNIASFLFLFIGIHAGVIKGDKTV